MHIPWPRRSPRSDIGYRLFFTARINLNMAKSQNVDRIMRQALARARSQADKLFATKSQVGRGRRMNTFKTLFIAALALISLKPDNIGPWKSDAHRQAYQNITNMYPVFNTTDGKIFKFYIDELAEVNHKLDKHTRNATGTKGWIRIYDRLETQQDDLKNKLLRYGELMSGYDVNVVLEDLEMLNSSVADYNDKMGIIVYMNYVIREIAKEASTNSVEFILKVLATMIAFVTKMGKVKSKARLYLKSVWDIFNALVELGPLELYRGYNTRCQYCGFKAKNFTDLLAHMKKEHPNEMRMLSSSEDGRRLQQRILNAVPQNRLSNRKVREALRNFQRYVKKKLPEVKAMQADRARRNYLEGVEDMFGTKHSAVLPAPQPRRRRRARTPKRRRPQKNTTAAGVYKDNPENRRLGRVGKPYGSS